MKKLYESLLDDESILMKNSDKAANNIKKQEIMQFIKDHYMIINVYGNSLKPERYIKINKDFTVDLLNKTENIYAISPEPKYGVKRTDEFFPTDGLFKWGKINTMYKIWGSEYSSVNDGKPEYIKMASLRRVKNLKCLPENVDKLILYDTQNISMEGCPETAKLIEISNCKNLTSLKGLPDNVNHLTLTGCNKLKTLEGAPKKINKFLYITGCNNLTSLDGLDKNAIKGSNFYYRLPNLITTPKEIAEFEPDQINHISLNEFKIKHNIK